MITPNEAVQDIDAVLVKLAANLDKIRGWSDRINADIQKVDQEFLIKVIPGLGPIATVVAEISTSLTAMVDALDNIADGLAANAQAKGVSVTHP